MRGKMLEVTSPDNWFTELFTRYASDLWNKPNREKPSGFTRQIVHDVRGKTYRLYDAKQTGESFQKNRQTSQLPWGSLANRANLHAQICLASCKRGSVEICLQENIKIKQR